MAAEGNASLSLSVTKGNFSDTRAINFQFDYNGTYLSSGVQNVGTTHELVAISSDVATLGACFFRNLSATNYVEIGIVVSSTFYPVLKLKPTEGQVVRLAVAYNALYAKSNTAACDLEYRVYQD